MIKSKIVVSLTTIPPRFGDLGKTINKLLEQELLADEIQIYIPNSYKRFPQHSFIVPEFPKGGGRVSVKIVNRDLGPATKALYCAKAHLGTNTRIIYCDDDMIPERTWLKSLLMATLKNADSAIASYGEHLKFYDPNITNRCQPRARLIRVIEQPSYIAARINQIAKMMIWGRSFPKPKKVFSFKRSGFVDIAAGYGGVSIKPDFFDQNSFEIPDILFPVDDIWLSGLLEKKGIRIWVDNTIPIPVKSSFYQKDALINFSYKGDGRITSNLKGIKFMQEKYSIWK